MPPTNKRVDDFLNKYGPTPEGKTVVGMGSSGPIYSDKTSAIDIERERFARKYGSAPAGQDLVGMKDNKPIYGDASQTAGYKTPSAEEISSTFQELENTKGYTPKPEVDLDKRKELASVLKQFARNEVKVNPEDMVKAGATMGVSRSQLSNLYQQYRKDFQANPPESATSMAASTPPAGTPAPMGVREGPVMGRTPDSTPPSYFQTPSGADTTPATTAQDRGPATPRLDRLAAMQGTPMGSVSIGAKGVQGATGGLAKGTSPTGGTPIGGGSGIGASPFGTRSSSARQMNNIVGANLFRAEQERFQQQEQQNLENERIRAEIDAYIKANRPPEYTKQPAFENANEKIPLFLRR